MSSTKYTGLNILLILALIFSMLAVLAPATPAQAEVTTITINSPTTASRAIVKPGGIVPVGFTLNGTTGGTPSINFQVWNVPSGNIFNQSFTAAENATDSQNITVDMSAPEGSYNLMLSRADNMTITTTQTGAIYVDSTAPVVTLTTPNAGTCWPGSTTQSIQWAASDTASTDNVTIYVDLSINGGSTYPTSIIAGTSYAQGAQVYSYTVPSSDSSICKIRIKAIDRAGNESVYTYSSNFSIITTGPIPTVVSPNGGEVWNGASSQTITGTITGSGTSVQYLLSLSTNSGATWTENITPTWTSATLTGGVYVLSYPWTVSNTVRSSTCRIRLMARDCAGNSGTDNSDADFRIVDVVAPTVTVTAPATGATWYSPSTQTIGWTQSDNVAGNLTSYLYYTIDGGANWLLITSASYAQGTNTYSWAVPSSINSTNCKIKVTATDAETPANTGTGYSGTFSINSCATTPSVTVCTPNGGESYTGGNVQSITWSAADAPDATVRMTYTIRLSSDGGATWTAMPAIVLTNQAQCSSCTCSYSWAVPNITTTQAMIQITATDPCGNYAVDTSNAVFSITTNPCGIDTVNVTLTQGWNLMSLPENPTSTNIDSVLSSVIPSVTSVWLYDSVCPATTASWYSYAPGAPSTLLTMEAGKAYWVNMATGGPYTLTFQGRKCPCPPASPTTITICRTGWNMVGFKSTIAKPVQTYLASLGTCGTAYLAPINGYAGGAWTTVNCSDNMTAGSGYWVYINSTGQITPGCD